ncbi:MAG TPA: T9SS type A sorting domain-containing protein, partial [bacterium]|nr:T9SS type A sorting domain-containing protein [bacterium]
TYWDAGASNADIVAQFDWWGTDNPDPSQFSTANGGTINHSAELSSDPGGGSSLAKSVASRLASSSFDPDNIDQDDPDDLWKLAQYYRFKKEIEKAIETNKEIIGRFSSTIYASKAMCQVFHIFEKQKRDGLKIYLKSMREKQLRGELKETVIDLSIIKSIRDKNYSQAIQLCKNVLEKLPDTRSELLALHNLVTLNNQMSNRKDATEYIDILKKKYPDSRLTLMAREIMGENVDWSGAKHYQTEDPQVAETDLPETLELSSVSPNPFNPTTNIRFVLPEAARVDISVYNLLGKRVWSHQSNNFKAGYHSVAWHGVDNTGSKVSSGIYIIRIRSKNQQATQKVMLMK